MAPELLKTLDARELVGVGKQVQQYQDTKGLSDSAMLRKFPGLGSTKTYNRVLNNDLAELDLEGQLARFNSVLALIESLGGEDERDEELYDDLSPVAHLKKSLLETMRTNSTARFIIVEGESGTGKTSCRRVISEKYGARTRWIEANEVWRDNPSAMLADILRVFGAKTVPVLPTDRLYLVLEKLNESRVTLGIDEGHHMGVRILNTVKTLINQSPGEVVTLAYPSLWRRLERTAFDECKQLTGNRLAERIQLSINEKDIEKIITRRVKNTGDVKHVVKLLAEQAPRYGNLAFVREICIRVNEAAEGTAGPDMEAWTSAMSAEVKSR